MITDASPRRIPDAHRALFSRRALAAIEAAPGSAAARRIRVTDETVALCAALAQAVRETVREVAPGRRVVVEDTWLVEADRLLRLDGADAATAAHVIMYVTQHHFWRSRISTMADLRRFYPRIASDSGFHDWRLRQGLIPVDPDVEKLCGLMLSLMKRTFPGTPDYADPRWLRVVASLIGQHSAAVVVDMMEYLARQRDWDGLHRLFLYESAARSLRRDPQFLRWGERRGCQWAFGA